MDLNRQRQLLDAPGIPEIDGEIASRASGDGQVQVEVIEHLRVLVPAAARQAWLEAEQASWEPWLQRQPGYLGRELHWDGARQEGQLLIRWASREQWYAIPRDDIEQVQAHFEQLAHDALERLGVLPQPLPSPPSSLTPSSQIQSGPPVTAAAPANPFPLVYSGELSPDATSAA
jgi:uncharacterized protein (TIGR03792 family)